MNFVSGEIINQRKVLVPKDIKLPELTEQLSEIGADMLVECVRSLPVSLDNATPQSEEGVTYGVYETNCVIPWQSRAVSSKIYVLYKENSIFYFSVLAKKINKHISEVRWSELDAAQVYNLYRAIYGLYPLTTNFKGKPMKLFNAFLYDCNECNYSKPVGSLEFCEKTQAIRVLCKDRRYIYFRSVRILGKREISALDFYNGYIKNMSVEKRQCMLC